MARIALAGHVCVDLGPRLYPGELMHPGALVEVGPLAITLGGCVGNTARMLSLLGEPFEVYTAVGDDRLADVVRGEIESLGGGIDGVLAVPDVGTSYSVVVEQPGSDRIFWHYPGACAHFDGRSAKVEDADLVHVGYPALLPALTADDGNLLVELLARGRASGATTSVDLVYVDREASYASLDWGRILERACGEADLLSPSIDDVTSALGIEEPFSEELLDRTAQQFLDWGAAAVMLTAGAHGLLLRTAGSDRLRTAGRALAPLAQSWADATVRLAASGTPGGGTTVGAGDSASAGLLSAVLRGFAPGDAARLADACAASVVGGQDLPSWALAAGA